MKSGEFIQWQDLFAIVDDGTIPLARYDPIESAMQMQAKRFPQGISFLVILPPGARPPPDEVQQSVRERLARLGPSLSCLAYLVEGTGFKAVAARAALISMKIFSSRPYPIYVETSMHAVLVKILRHLNKGKTVTSDVGLIMKAISDDRAKWKASPPTLSPPST